MDLYDQYGGVRACADSSLPWQCMSERIDGPLIYVVRRWCHQRYLNRAARLPVQENRHQTDKLVCCGYLTCNDGCLVCMTSSLPLLVDRENHRTATQYEDTLTSKFFAFQFINSYFSLFYLAWFKQGRKGESYACSLPTPFNHAPLFKSGLFANGELFGFDDRCVDENNNVQSCMGELSSQVRQSSMVQTSPLCRKRFFLFTTGYVHSDHASFHRQRHGDVHPLAHLQGDGEQLFMVTTSSCS